MAEIARPTGGRDWIDLGVVERERTPESAMALGIQSALVFFASVSVGIHS
jgi:hypothetical protein